MHLLKYRDAVQLRGDFALHRAVYRDPMTPCIKMEHRHGRCPLGICDVETREGSNLILTAPKTAIMDLLAGVGGGPSLAISYVACGTSSAPRTAGMTQLGAESYRTNTIEKVKPSSNAVTVFWFFGTTVANAGSMLQEWAMFAGAATGAANSGTPLASFLDPFDKNSFSTCSGQWTGTLT